MEDENASDPEGRLNLYFTYRTGSYWAFRIHVGYPRLILDYYGYDGTFARMWDKTLS